MATEIAVEPETLTATEPEGLYEVVDGQVREKPQMGSFEIELAMILARLLDTFGRANELGRANTEMLYLLDRDTKLRRRPDVAFVSAERWGLERRAPRTAAWDVVPDLAVEIISPTNQTEEDMRKVQEYFRAGVRQVWMILPALEQVQVFPSPTESRILSRSDVLDAAPVVPGFRLVLADFFGQE